MRGVVLPGDGTARVERFPDPTPGPGEVVIEITASGMCGTDLKFLHGDSDLRAAGLIGAAIAGHEPCGVVVAIGRDVHERTARPGQRVMVHHYSGCGSCEMCRTGWTQMCTNGPVVAYGYSANGGHADLMRVDARTLVPLPDELSAEVGAAISCGAGTAWAALERLSVRGDQTIAIFGQGPVGLAATMLAAALGARVIALDVSEERLARAAELGAAHTVNPEAVDPVSALRDLSRGRGVDASLDASGSPIARRQAVLSVRPWGQTCFVGEGGDVTFDVSTDLLRRQIRLHGSWTFSSVQQEQCARFVADRSVPLDLIFSDRWSLDQADEAYRLFDARTRGKGVFTPAATSGERGAH